jgi:hypothetical protein
MRQMKARKAPWRKTAAFWVRTAVGCLTAAGLVSCASNKPPRQADNLCDIFDEKGDWFDAAQVSEARWGAPIPVKMAIMWRESSYRHDAEPPDDHILWVVPWGNVSSAYGYAQALDGTWGDYQKATGRGWADRDEFDDAIDFIGWYMSETNRRAGVSMNDAYGQYLAYHEGITGYRRGSYVNKPGVQRAARQVARQAEAYQRQLSVCRAVL